MSNPPADPPSAAGGFNSLRPDQFTSEQLVSDPDPNTGVTSGQAGMSAPPRREQFPHLTLAQWCGRARVLRHRHDEFWKQHPEQYEAFALPRAPNVIDLVTRMYARQRRNERRAARRAEGKFV